MEDNFDHEHYHLRKESDAPALGNHTTGKHLHAIYRIISRLSSTEHAEKGNLYQPERTPHKIPFITQADLAKFLHRLLHEKLIAQVPALEFIPEQTALQPTCFYISMPSGSSSRVIEIAEESMLQSLKAIRKWSEARPALDGNRLQRSYELDLKSSRYPEPSDLQPLLFHATSELKRFQHIIGIDDRLVRWFGGEIEQRLIDSGDVVTIPNYGVVPLRPNDLSTIYLSATSYLESKVIPQYKAKAARDLRLILAEETGWQIDSRGMCAATSRYTRMRAEAIQKISSKKEENHFPGALVVRLLVNLADAAEEYFARDWDRLCREKARQFKVDLLSPGNDWQRAIRFLTDNDLKQIAPDVIDIIKNDKELVSTTWNDRNNCWHVFCAQATDVIWMMVRGMQDLPERQLWKVLALRTIIEEHEIFFKPLFADGQFVRLYGKLLRRAYISFMPWYYRIYFLFSFKSALDLFFGMAKSRIKEEQMRLAAIHQTRIRKAEEEDEIERREKREKLRDYLRISEINETIESLFFEKKVIPTKHDLREHFAAMSEEELESLLQRGRIREVEMENGDPILLPPVDSSWHGKQRKIGEWLDQLITENKENPSDDDQKLYQLDKAQKLKTWFARKGSIKSKLPFGKKEDEDPYKRLEQELHALSHREQHGGGSAS